MVCNQTFYFISASKYIKILRPKLMKYYGGIDTYRALKGERQKLKMAYLFKYMGQKTPPPIPLHLIELEVQGPLKKYLKKEEQKTQKQYLKLRQHFQKNTKQIYSVTNQFLRLDRYLQQIDSFDNSDIKVSNILQVQNYCRYLKTTRKILQEHPDCQWAEQYGQVDLASVLFTEVHKKMKKEKQETYLIYKVA